MIYNLKLASIHVPKVIISAKVFSLSDQLVKNDLINKYKPSITFYNLLLFYSDLFMIPDTYIDYDYFGYIPLTYPEIVMAVYHANQLNTLMTGQLSTNGLRVKYAP